ncbi:MAG: hypothetical protein HW416_1497 [Chloroflexi bacterium]|nr:hypothetical protein [Chloroflexota bacterium]
MATRMLSEPLARLLSSTARAKRTTGAMYLACRDRSPGLDARLALDRLAQDEGMHADSISALVAEPPAVAFTPMPAPVAVGRGIGAEAWPSALMSAFALDQAATAALLALSLAPDAVVAAVAQRIADEECAHQAFAIGAFRLVADVDTSVGARLAAEMIQSRDWVQQAYPRRRALEELVNSGVLPSEARKAHDTFLASLGDRVQEALGVLGC